MSEIKRIEISEEWAHSGVVEAGDLVFVSYCMANEGKPIVEQMNGAFDLLEERLEAVGLSLSSVVKLDCLFKNIEDLEYLADVIKKDLTVLIPQERHMKPAL